MIEFVCFLCEWRFSNDIAGSQVVSILVIAEDGLRGYNYFMDMANKLSGASNDFVVVFMSTALSQLKSSLVTITQRLKLRHISRNLQSANTNYIDQFSQALFLLP